MYNDVNERNRFIQDFNIPILYENIDYGNLPVEVLNTQDWVVINETYQRDKLVIVDNFLKPEYVDILRKYVLITNVRQNIYPDYAALNFYRKPGFLWFKLLTNIVDECKNYMSFLNDLTFERAWSFIYSNFSDGVRIHADPASVNLNLWVTPEESLYLKPEFNGLNIWQIKRPSDWDYKKYNGDEIQSTKFVEESGIAPAKIDYKFNRIVIFDSSFFHKTMPVRSKPGYQNRRINYTFLYSNFDK